mgnify:CR=1 FL=1
MFVVECRETKMLLYMEGAVVRDIVMILSMLMVRVRVVVRVKVNVTARFKV